MRSLLAFGEPFGRVRDYGVDSLNVVGRIRQVAIADAGFPRLSHLEAHENQ
jgi:hypothetical protein